MLVVVCVDVDFVCVVVMYCMYVVYYVCDLVFEYVDD